MRRGKLFVVLPIIVVAGIMLALSSGDAQSLTVGIPDNMVAGERHSGTVTLSEEFFEQRRVVDLYFTNNEFRTGFAVLHAGENAVGFKVIPQAEGAFSVKAVYGDLNDEAVRNVDAAPPRPVPNMRIWIPDRITMFQDHYGTVTMTDISTDDRTVLLSSTGGINLHQTHIIIPAGIASQAFHFTGFKTSFGNITATHGDDVAVAIGSPPFSPP